ncbi:hypothetical protein FRX31_030849 [Thalictrum thalictroides]|uniref:Uncharacterized protein n=1 Tax=Thalictrum thalictroides TaxID=46969 RepID=A0A7J6V3C0_THATH|nr:hypothetical protein FRX31_030849 [Thalictrum thalictroides]
MKRSKVLYQNCSLNPYRSFRDFGMKKILGSLGDEVPNWIRRESVKRKILNSFRNLKDEASMNFGRFVLGAIDDRND